MEHENTMQEVAMEAAPQNELKVLQKEETPEARIQEEVKKFNLADSKIAEMQKKAKGLKIRPLPPADDKKAMTAFREETKKVRETLAVVRSARTGIEKMRKHLKDDYLKIGKGIDAEAKRLTALIEPIEEPLKAMLEAAEQAEEDRKREAERLAQEKLQGRVAQLLEAGIKFDGAFYSIGDISVDVVTISSLEDSKFEELIVRVGITKAGIDAEAKRLEEEKAEALRKQEEEAQRLRDEQAKLEEDRKKLEAEKQELEAAKEKARQEAIQRRRIQLEGLGFTYLAVYGYFSLSNPSGKLSVLPSDMTEATEEAWVEMFDKLSKEAEDLKTKENERLAQVEQEEKLKRLAAEVLSSRISFLKGKGFMESAEGLVYRTPLIETPILVNLDFLQRIESEKWDGWVKQTEEAMADLMERSNKAQQEAYEAGEAARKAKLNEAERLHEYFDLIMATPRPENIQDPGLNNVFVNFIRCLEASHEAVQGN